MDNIQRRLRYTGLTKKETDRVYRRVARRELHRYLDARKGLWYGKEGIRRKEVAIVDYAMMLRKGMRHAARFGEERYFEIALDIALDALAWVRGQKHSNRR